MTKNNKVVGFKDIKDEDVFHPVFLMMFDMNGVKGPNVWGKDIFGLNIFIDGNLSPIGSGWSINELKSDLLQCSNALCVNSLCPLREPEKGFGDEMFARRKANNESLFNNKDFAEIAAEKGYEIRKISALSVTKSKENN